MINPNINNNQELNWLQNSYEFVKQTSYLEFNVRSGEQLFMLKLFIYVIGSMLTI